MAELDPNAFDILAVQTSLAEGSEVTSIQMMALSIALVLTLVLVIVFCVVIYNANRVREEKMSTAEVALVFRRLAFAVAFLVISTLLLGVFYVF